jgi:hypothetical protein
MRIVLQKRMHVLIWGGYSPKQRYVAPKLAGIVKAANGGLCCKCGEQPSTQVDHMNGPSNERENLQGVCEPCHDAKTQATFGFPMERDGDDVEQAAAADDGKSSVTRDVDSPLGVYSFLLPVEPEEEGIRDAFLLRVTNEPPSRACDHGNWDEQRRPLLAQTKTWCKAEAEAEPDEMESGSFGDGSTGTEDDHEHGIYMQMLADRDD